jgi:hypothetical protein
MSKLSSQWNKKAYFTTDWTEKQTRFCYALFRYFLSYNNSWVRIMSCSLGHKFKWEVITQLPEVTFSLNNFPSILTHFSCLWWNLNLPEWGGGNQILAFTTTHEQQFPLPRHCKIRQDGANGSVYSEIMLKAGSWLEKSNEIVFL